MSNVIGWRKNCEAMMVAYDYANPIYSTSAHFRETKPWYVCPRDPLIDGFRFDSYPFLCTAGRDPGESPARQICVAASLGLGIGIYGCIKDSAATESIGQNQKMHQNVRSTHAWAMQRMGWVWVMRPCLLLAGMAAGYTIPKELFSQNFGRRNRRGHFDLLPHFVGLGGLYFSARVLAGRHAARKLMPLVGLTGSMYYWCKSTGGGLVEVAREIGFPIVMAFQYGAPGDHNQWDTMVGGEHATHWRMESAVQYPYLFSQIFQVKSTDKLDDHPLTATEWGHTSVWA
eukprot:TRINITY_DN14818_c0_g1_i1.p1 TRINITY_DN14818_c0_g1~~TRINITY_DN14818_c0_g1_i1.p1  ORF type:complete len:286 (+),score=11.15 TRINITY_DN14818_c0_g1_i1:67-924(+)